MKIGIYDPYLDSLGGGERYVLTLAEFLSRTDEVKIFWADQSIKKKIEERLNIKTDKISFVSNIFVRGNNLLQKFLLTNKYDLIFFLSDGSIPLIFAKQGIFHFQVPFHKINAKNLFNRIKLSRFRWIVCNSNFTKKFIDKNYGVESLVIYPPVSVKDFRPEKKRNLILSVGRFTKTLHNKKQELMIAAFKDLAKKLEDWELVLAGGAMPQDYIYLKELKDLAKDASIKILHNLPFKELRDLYGQAKIYWHAAGFGLNEEESPEKMEHFGISTVEAMASGCIPMVFAGGGQKEIITNGVNGFLWQKVEELKDQTLILAKMEEEKLAKIALAARERSEDFSQEKFYEAFSQIIYH